jgi:hypothetical protein
MNSSTVQRRLAAILAADVAGYSRLMGTDEVGTLAALKAHRRELIDLEIAAHHGRMAKHHAEKETDRISEAALFRRAGIHPRGAPSPRGAGRPEPDHCSAAIIPTRGSSTPSTP